MEQQEKKTTQKEFVKTQGEDEEVKCIDYMLDLEAGLLSQENTGKSSNFKQYCDAFLGFVEEAVIIIIIVLILYGLTMVGLFYVMTMTKVLF